MEDGREKEEKEGSRMEKLVTILPTVKVDDREVTVLRTSFPGTNFFGREIVLMMMDGLLMWEFKCSNFQIRHFDGRKIPPIFIFQTSI